MSSSDQSSELPASDQSSGLSTDMNPDILVTAVCMGKNRELHVERLLKAGWDVNVSTKKGRRALHQAASYGCLSLVDLLLDHGADVDTRTLRLQWTPLQIASLNGHTGVVKRLLEHGANVNGVCKNGRTALRRAALYSHDETVCLLLQNMADPFYSASDGEKAVDAAGRDHAACVSDNVCYNCKITQHLLQLSESHFDQMIIGVLHHCFIKHPLSMYSYLQKQLDVDLTSDSQAYANLLDKIRSKFGRFLIARFVQSLEDSGYGNLAKLVQERYATCIQDIYESVKVKFKTNGSEVCNLPVSKWSFLAVNPIIPHRQADYAITKMTAPTPNLSADCSTSKPNLAKAEAIHLSPTEHGILSHDSSFGQIAEQIPNIQFTYECDQIASPNLNAEIDHNLLRKWNTPASVPILPSAAKKRKIYDCQVETQRAPIPTSPLHRGVLLQGNSQLTDMVNQWSFSYTKDVVEVARANPDLLVSEIVDLLASRLSILEYIRTPQSNIADYIQSTPDVFMKPDDTSHFLVPSYLHDGTGVLMTYKRVDDPNQMYRMPSNPMVPYCHPASPSNPMVPYCDPAPNTHSVVTGPPAEHQLYSLACKLGTSWTPLAIELGIGFDRTKQIQESHPHDADRRNMTMLMEWRRGVGDKPHQDRVNSLVQALEDINVGRRDLAIPFREMMTGTTSQEPR